MVTSDSKSTWGCGFLIALRWFEHKLQPASCRCLDACVGDSGQDQSQLKNNLKKKNWG